MESIKNMNEELEKEIERHLNNCLDIKFPTTDIKSIKLDVVYTARYFAQWMKEQMMKDAVESRVSMTSGGLLFEDLCYEDVDYEDKVKVIIIKDK